MLAWILWPISAYISLISLYMLGIVVGAWLYRSPGRRDNLRRRVAVIVPAHNEGDRIVRTLSDLASGDYPKDLCSVLVIADNCSDDTAHMARSCGAEVFERKDLTARGKGPALDWLLRSQRDYLAGFDIIAFVDADMFVDPGFVSALNLAFSHSDIEVVQGRNTVANPTASWLAAFGFMSFAYVNHVRPAGRCFWGGSCGLKGSGMAFRSSLILSTGWPTTSVAEDLDFGKELLLRGSRIHYVPAAVVTSDIAPQLRQVSVQQARWEGGKHQVVMRFLPRIVSSFIRSPSRKLLDEFLDMLIPPFSLYVVLLLLCGVVAVLTAAIPASLVIASAAIFAAAILTGLIQLRAPLRTLGYLALAPLFLLMKILLFVKLAVKPHSTDWHRTPRDGE